MNNSVKIAAITSLTLSDENSYQAPKSIWRVRIGGKFIATRSGKTAWKRIGDAKNALINHLEYDFRYPLSAKDIMRELVADGTVELIEFTLGENREVTNA